MPLYLADPLLPDRLVELVSAAPRCDAAFPIPTENPLLMLPTRDNLLDVKLDGVLSRALIDTGAHISLMNANLRTRLRKILTPALSHGKVPNGGRPAITGLCTCRVTIIDRDTTVVFAVLDNVPRT